MNLDQFSLNMALRFENDSKTLLGRLNCFDMYLRFYKHGRYACMFRPHLFAILHVYFVRLNFQFLSFTGPE